MMWASTSARTEVPRGATSSRLRPPRICSRARRASGLSPVCAARRSEANPLLLFAPHLDATALLAREHAPALLDLLHALRRMSEAAAAARATLDDRHERRFRRRAEPSVVRQNLRGHLRQQRSRELRCLVVNALQLTGLRVQRLARGRRNLL